jgi:[ribosomal protein S5]-alanine N-acetyltransferase
MAGIVVFETERLLVRPLHPTDFDNLHAICGDPLVMHYVGNLQPYTLEQTRQAIEKAQVNYQAHGFGGWAIFDKANGRFLGYGGLEYLPERNVPEVFYIFPPAYWGQGYATEFARAAVRYGFEQCNLPAIGASFDPTNLPSMRVAQKVGLRYDYEGLDEFGLPTVYYILRRESAVEGEISAD